MADKKISELTSVTTPLAGSEVIPIVQSNSTKKVSVANLTAGREIAALRANIGEASGQNDVFDVTIGSNGATTGANTGLVVVTSSTGKGWIGFNNANNSSIPGQLTYDFSSGQMGFRATGNYFFDLGNIIIGTAGKGIDFSAAGNAAGMTSELLADYEEGTWTPSIEGTTSAGTGTYNARNGAYTKIGRFVYFQLWINMTSHTGTGDMIITGLPFTSQTGGGITYYSSGLVGYGGGVTAPVDSVVTWFIANNSATIVLNSASTAGSYGTSALAIDTSFNFSISGYYIAA